MPARLSTLLALVAVAYCSESAPESALSLGGGHGGTAASSVKNVLESPLCASLCATGDYEEKDGGCRCAVGCKDPNVLFKGIKVTNGVLWGKCDPDDFVNKKFKKTLKQDSKCSYDKCRGTDGGTVRPGHTSEITCSKLCIHSVYTQTFKTRPDGTANPTEGSPHSDPTNDSRYHKVWCRLQKYTKCTENQLSQEQKECLKQNGPNAEAAKCKNVPLKSCTGGIKTVCLAITPRHWKGKKVTGQHRNECAYFPAACELITQKE